MTDANGSTRAIDFQFEVRDKHEIIARGLRKRGVINAESFPGAWHAS